MINLIAIVAAVASAAHPAPAPKPPPLLSVARYRSAGATVRKLVVRRDGSFTIDDPTGGAGRKFSTGRLPRAQLRDLRRTVRTTPWDHPGRRTTTLPEVDPVAYFLVRHEGRSRTVLAQKVPVGLLPLLRKANGILDSGHFKVRSRFRTA